MGHSLPWISWQHDFYRVGLSTSCPTPNLQDQASIFVTPRDRVTQLYPQALGTHFSCLLQHAWAMLGLFLSSGHHMERIAVTCGLLFILQVIYEYGGPQWIDIDRGNQRTRRTCPSVALFTTNPMCTDPSVNVGPWVIWSILLKELNYWCCQHPQMEITSHYLFLC
jgi:hypothetical protein